MRERIHQAVDSWKHLFEEAADTLWDVPETAYREERSSRFQMQFLQRQGFEVVEYRVADADSLDEVLTWFEVKIRHFEIPSDGLEDAKPLEGPVIEGLFEMATNMALEQMTAESEETEETKT